MERLKTPATGLTAEATKTGVSDWQVIRTATRTSAITMVRAFLEAQVR
jgi:hypothetical protein